MFTAQIREYGKLIREKEFVKRKDAESFLLCTVNGDHQAGIVYDTQFRPVSLVEYDLFIGEVTATALG